MTKENGLGGDIEKCCENCRFFSGEPGERGDCRRYAPQPSNVRLRGSNDGSVNLESYWPTMSHDDWCGDFEPLDGRDW